MIPYLDKLAILGFMSDVLDRSAVDPWMAGNDPISCAGTEKNGRLEIQRLLVLVGNERRETKNPATTSRTRPIGLAVEPMF